MHFQKSEPNSNMPDVASQKIIGTESYLDYVGMESVDVPICFMGQISAARADLYVNLLSGNTRGIHMSRLYLALEEGLKNKELSWSVIKRLLKNFCQSQVDISSKSRLVLRWSQLIERAALISENKGWKKYPIKIEAEYKTSGQIDIRLRFSVYYASTCPCSAALARQLKKDNFLKTFKTDEVHRDKVARWIEENQVAAPHSQRSRADITLMFQKNVSDEIDLVKYIDLVESALKTPVQTAVKRQDEQEFARLNGENLMFVEDALRAIKKSLSNVSEVKTFKVVAKHFESLHAHNAVGTIIG